MSKGSIGHDLAQSQSTDKCSRFALAQHLHTGGDLHAAEMIYRELIDEQQDHDTAVAHLAGTLGREVWLLLPFVPDWRWLTETDRTNWYPSMRLFRQPGRSAWADVIAYVRLELAARTLPLPAKHRTIDIAQAGAC